MKKKTAAIIALSVLLVLSAACHAFASINDPLTGTSWELVSYGDTRPLEERPVTIRFENGQVSGSGGCNSYGGSYQITGEKLAIGELYSTLMACPEPEGVMLQEGMFLQFLGEAQRFELADGQLQIIRSGGETLMFVPRE